MRKFYRIEREGTRVTVTWGRIGSRGQHKVLELASEAAAEAAYEAEKLRRQERGYRKVYDESRPHDPEAARAAATSARLAAAAPLTTAARFMFVNARRRAFVWLEQRGNELWWASGGVGDEAAAVPESRSFGSPAKASRHQSRRIAELLASGYALEAFDAKPPKRGKVAKPRPAPAPALARPARQGSVYASWLGVTGHYGCLQPDLSDCKGLQGSACKHLLVLVLGLARAGQLPMAQALQWLKAAHGKRPRRDEELCADTLIQYKGAEAGELDWRPTETIPEDFYAV